MAWVLKFRKRHYKKEILKDYKKKIKVFQKHKKNIYKTTILVISSAIKSNPELIEAKKLKLPIYKVLGHIVSLMRNVVVTVHMAKQLQLLISNIYTKLDPTIINGILNSFGNSAKLGKSNCV